MEGFSTVALLVLGIIAFLNFRSGTLGDWLKAKFFNAADPAPPELGDIGGGTWTTASSGPPRVGAGSSTVGSSGWMAPADGPIVSGFGGRKSPGGIGSTNHKGIDIDGRTGDPVRASRDGKVTYAGNSGGYGLRVSIDHGGGISTLYGHLSRLEVRVGQAVKAGQVIGRIGATGTATGDHLHFEIRRNGVPIDPAPYLTANPGLVPVPKVG